MREKDMGKPGSLLPYNHTADEKTGKIGKWKNEEKMKKNTSHPRIPYARYKYHRV